MSEDFVAVYLTDRKKKSQTLRKYAEKQDNLKSKFQQDPGNRIVGSGR